METEGLRIHLTTVLTIVKTVDARGIPDHSGNRFGATEPESGHNEIRIGRGMDENDGHSCFDERSRTKRHACEGTALENADTASNELKGHKFTDEPPTRTRLARTTAMEYASK